jgi:hypothetical protein
MTQRYALLTSTVLLALLAAGVSELQAQEERPPFTLDQLTQMVESGVFSDQRILFLVKEACLGFRLDDEAAGKLRASGASEGLVANLRNRSQCVKLPRAVTFVAVARAELAIATGSTGILRAQALDPDSAAIPNVVFEWSSDDTTVAVVSQGGVVMGRSPGMTWVRAVSPEGPVGMARVNVSAAVARQPAEPTDTLGTRSLGGKSPTTAGALGFLLPGGGEFYSGNTAKGVVVLLGAAAGLATGYFITSEEITGFQYSTATPTATCQVDPGTGNTLCTYSATRTDTIKETRQIVIGAAVAGAFWLYGLIDGVRSAKRSRATPASQLPGDETPDLSLELMPVDGLRVTFMGDVELTLLRVRS